MRKRNVRLNETEYRVLGRSKSSSRCVQCPMEQRVCPLEELGSEYGNKSGEKGKGQEGRGRDGKGQEGRGKGLDRRDRKGGKGTGRKGQEGSLLDVIRSRGRETDRDGR